MSQLTDNYDEVRVFRGACQVPTVPPSEYRSDGTWIVTDLVNGQVAVNIIDKKAWYRAGVDIIELANYSTIIQNLADLNDVNLTSLANNNILQYDSTAGVWKNISAPIFEGLVTAKEGVLIPLNKGIFWGDGDTGFTQTLDGNIVGKINGATVFVFDGNGIRHNITNRPFIRFNLESTRTNPVFMPKFSSNATGIGGLINELSLICVATEVARFTTTLISFLKNLEVNGTAKIGDIAGGNYTEFESDGTKVAKGNATTFRDELGDALNLKISGTGLSLNLDEGVIVFNNLSNLLDYAFRNVQINHDWLFGSNLEPHAHAWQTTNANPNLLLGYRWQKNGGAKTTAWSYLKMNTPVFTYVSGTLNQIWSCGATCITPPAGYGISDVVQMKIFRDNANDSGLFTGVDTYTGDLSIMSFDTHLESDTDGSRNLYGK